MIRVNHIKESLNVTELLFLLNTEYIYAYYLFLNGDGIGKM